MPRSVHLLKLFKTLLDNSYEAFTFSSCSGLVCVGKVNDRDLREIVDNHNRRNKASVFINNMENSTNVEAILPSKALTLHRLKLFGALVGQVKGYALIPSLSFKLDLKATPERFQNKFKNILVDGFWLLGRVIADSLSEDSSVNCGNPFGFSPGDLAFWWAGCVMLDWSKNENSKCKKQSYMKCYDFYNDFCISRKFKYYQNSGDSTFNYRFLQDFLSEKDFELFTVTIKNVRLFKYYGLIEENVSESS